MKKLRSATFYIVLICCLCNSYSIFAKDVKSYLFVGSEFPLILEKGRYGNASGLSMEILEAIGKNINSNINVKLMPWARAIRLVKNGQADGLIGPYKSKERLIFLDYAEQPYYKDNMVFIKKKGELVGWNGDYKSIEGKKIVTIDSWVYGKEFDNLQNSFRIYKNMNYVNAMEMLIKGRVNLLAINERNAAVQIEKRSLKDKVEVLRPPFASNFGYFAFSKKINDLEFQKLFNKAQNSLSASGEIKKMNQKYGLKF